MALLQIQVEVECDTTLADPETIAELLLTDADGNDCYPHDFLHAEWIDD